MDYDFFLRAWLKDVPIATFQHPIPTLMRDAGISSQQDWPSLRQRFLEERRIHATHCDNPFWKLVYAVYWSIYPAYRRILLYRSEEHTSELQSLMRISYAVFCLKK